jgi:hypothetical protein
MLVRFPDGTTVRASALWERRAEDPERDYGLYFDRLWRPTWPADVLEWENNGVPQDPPAAAEMIREAFRRARAGGRVEIGCIAGLGRTGTALACMAILAGVPPDGAVDWVRSHYDPAAVETPEQEAWVEWFAGHVKQTAHGS